MVGLSTKWSTENSKPFLYYDDDPDDDDDSDIDLPIIPAKKGRKIIRDDTTDSEDEDWNDEDVPKRLKKNGPGNKRTNRNLMKDPKTGEPPRKKPRVGQLKEPPVVIEATTEPASSGTESDTENMKPKDLRQHKVVLPSDWSDKDPLSSDEEEILDSKPLKKQSDISDFYRSLKKDAEEKAEACAERRRERSGATAEARADQYKYETPKMVKD